LLVIGGSLGAQVLNETVPRAIALMDSDERPEVRHQAGERNIDAATAVYADCDVAAQVVPFIEDMAEAYNWADLVLCRAGALTVSELAAAGMASILVPYIYAVDDHQTANARYLEQAGAARLLPQPEMDVETLKRVLTEMSDRALLQNMAGAARRMAMNDAAEKVADACIGGAA
jgi:UDP-N-acetylglucosamine--N-acetylmuramyl-(pentapeptide) pyrophosphoryl-undecaprenol N-acetylglucosamine transferase